MFLATGVHPEVERARAAQQDIIPPLPERSTQRQHAFLDIAINTQTRGEWGGMKRGCGLTILMTMCGDKIFETMYEPSLFKKGKKT